MTDTNQFLLDFLKNDEAQCDSITQLALCVVSDFTLDPRYDITKRGGEGLAGIWGAYISNTEEIACLVCEGQGVIQTLAFADFHEYKQTIVQRTGNKATVLRQPLENHLLTGLKDFLIVK